MLAQDDITKRLPGEDEIAALIREYAEVSVDGDDIRVSGAHAAASMILHRVKMGEAIVSQAKEIERLRAGIAAIQQATFQHYDTVWFDKTTTMYDYCEELLHPVSSGQQP